MAIDATAPFIWGANGSQLTPAQAEAQRKVAQALMTNGMDYSPVKSAWQGAARMAQAALGGFEGAQADASDKATAAMQPKLLADAIAASQGGSPAAPVVGGPSGPGDTAVPPAGATAIPAGKDEFVSSVMPLAQEASAKTGLDPRLIVAQAALESGYGQHAPGNNLFGIKSHGQPGGNVLPTSEVVNGQPVQTSDSFRAYASPADSVSGYADFINTNPRYAPVKAAQGLEGQAAALGQSGYATDPNYGSKVLQIARALPAPTDGVLAANSPSPLDNAQYPAGPVGASTQAAGAPADDGEDALPANAAPAQGTLPTTQAVQAASQPQSAIAKIAPLIATMNNPYASEATKKITGLLLTSALEQQKQASDPKRKLEIEKLQADLKEKKTVVVNGRLVDAQTGETIKDYSDIGKTPEGSKLVRDSSGNVIAVQPLPGSPEDTKNKAAQQKQDQQKQQQNRYGDIVTQDIDRALKGIDSASLPVTGAIGSMTSNIPGTASHDVSSLLSTIKANIGFDRLQQMRASSPTGGALGQVSDFENKLLQATIGNLEQSQSKGQLKQNLNRVYNTYMDIIHGLGNGPARRPLDGITSSATPDRSAVEAEMKRRGLL